MGTSPHLRGVLCSFARDAPDRQERPDIDMKRAQALRQLSRDHHKALFVAQRLRRVERSDVEACALEFLDFWRSHGHRHFQVEEEVLLPAYERVASAEEEPVVRVLTDHMTIRRRAADVEAGARSVGPLQELGSILEGHVRHEERVLFPLIEEALPAAELETLAREIAQAESEDS
jgi:hemerythrin-like domain-containing protein